MSTPGQWRWGDTPSSAMFGTGRADDGSPCTACDGTGHVCADDGTASYPAGSHGSRLHPWDGLSERADACDHGGGAPCPVCMVAPGDEPENPPVVVDAAPYVYGGIGQSRTTRPQEPFARPDLTPLSWRLPDWDPLPPPVANPAVLAPPDVAPGLRDALAAEGIEVVESPLVPPGQAYLFDRRIGGPQLFPAEHDEPVHWTQRETIRAAGYRSRWRRLVSWLARSLRR